MQTKHAKRNRMRRLMQAGILLCLMVMAGCAKDENLLDNENLSQNLSSEMKLVKDKFDKQYYTGLQTRTSSEEFRSMFIDLKPDWENAIEEENDDEKVILVPIRVKGIEININYECSQRYNETKDERYLNTRTLLCFKVNKKTKKEDFFFMSFAPSESYLVKNNFDLTNNFYFKRDKNYDGKVIYHDINSNFVNGWEYQKGKITAFEYPKLNNKSAVTTRSNSEEIVCYESWRVTVTTYYYSVNGGPLHYNFSRVESSSDQFCVFANPTGNRPAIWWIDDSDGSGKGGGGYTPPAPITPLHPTLKVLFKGTNSLTKEDTEKLNKAFEEMRQKCFYETINKYVIRKGVQLGNIKMDPNYGGAKGLGGLSSDGNLTFKESSHINTDNLCHEWIHLYQKTYNNMTLYGDKKGMMEYEKDLIQDILNFVQFGDFSKFHTWSNQMSVKLQDQLTYQNWIIDITKNGTSLPTIIDNKKYQELSILFGKYNSGYSPENGYVYGTNIYDSSTIQSLFIESINNCK